MVVAAGSPFKVESKIAKPNLPELGVPACMIQHWRGAFQQLPEVGRGAFQQLPEVANRALSD